MSYLGVVGLLSALILIHEAGHLAAAKWMRIPVAGFSLGFGPKVWSRRWGQTDYSLRALPLGGFVLPALDEAEFRALALRRRLGFFFAGPLANLLAAVPLFAVLNAARGGLSLYGLLIAPFWQVAVACLQLLNALPGLASHPGSVLGFVGIVVEGGRLARAGGALELAISLSVSLAVLNLLPIPVLDGGQALLSCCEQAFPPLIRLRVPLTILGMLALGSLLILSNVHDVVRYWG